MARYRIRRTPDGPVVTIHRNAYWGSLACVAGALVLAWHAFGTAWSLSGSGWWGWAGLAATVLALRPWYQDLRWAATRIPRLLLGGDEVLFDRQQGEVVKNDLVQCKIEDIRRIAILTHSRVPRLDRRYVGSSYLVGLLMPDGTFVMVDDTWDEISAWKLQQHLCSTLRIPAVFVDVETEGIPVEAQSVAV